MEACMGACGRLCGKKSAAESSEALLEHSEPIRKQILDDKQAHEHLEQNRKWMLEGYVREEHKQDVDKAFEIIKNDIPISEGANGEVEDMVTGPGVKWALYSNVATWATFGGVTIISKRFVAVDDTGIAGTPGGLSVLGGLGCWIGFTALALIFEYKALMYCLPSQAVCVARKWMTSPSDKPGMSFDKWMLLMFGISVALHADVYTTGLFMARVWKSVSEANTLNNLWRLAICSSALKHIPIVNVITYGQLCMLAWCLMIMQLVYALFYSIPISPNVAKGQKIASLHRPNKVTYEMVETKEQVNKYDTVLKKDTGHGRCLQALSESGRMCSLNWQDDNYLEQAEYDWDARRVHDEMRRTNVRFLLFCLQATVVPTLQITFLGFQKLGRVQQENYTPDYLTVISFAISFFCGLHYIWYEFGAVARHKKYIWTAINRDKDDATKKEDGRAYWEAHLLERKASFSICFNYTFIMIFACFYCFILIKALMAIVFCNSGIWNAKWPLMHGCVDKHSITNLSHYAPLNFTATCSLIHSGP